MMMQGKRALGSCETTTSKKVRNYAWLQAKVMATILGPGEQCTD